MFYVAVIIAFALLIIFTYFVMVLFDAREFRQEETPVKTLWISLLVAPFLLFFLLGASVVLRIKGNASLWVWLPILLPILIAVLVTFLTFIENLRKNQIKKKTMEPIVFFTAMQAFAAFLQVWQTERNKEKALRAYTRTLIEAREYPEVIAKANALAALIQDDLVLGRIFRNQMGRCKDRFEENSRVAEPEQLDEVVNAFKHCTCLVLNAIRNAQNGELRPPLSEDWNKFNCPVVLAKN